ncbi:hypothetical protein [Streptomyces sp. NPDC049949]|uniref:hypothetical protein n=1 Tax=Streptomyces sp. NPDC049949 TaxID=3154627 RepID=UPI0034217A8D
MSDSSVQVATVVISVAALVLSTTAAFWALVYDRRQARGVAQADALTEKAQREQAEPYVIVDIRPRIPGSSPLVLAIENIGQTLARNVRIAVSPPPQATLGAERAATLNRAVGRPIATLPPKRRIPFVIYTVDLEALRDSALETDSVEWSTPQISKHLKRSADAQEEQSRSVEALSSEVRKRPGRQRSEQTSGVEDPELAELALLEIPMRPLSGDGDLESRAAA